MGTPLELPDSLVSVEWLADHLGADGLQVVDIRGQVTTEDLGGGRQAASYSGARDRYAQGHIPGATFVDWTTDIVDPDGEVKAQIAKPDRFKLAMEALGVGDDIAVVIVDDSGGHLATRLWWALQYYGHDAVAILDGGFAAWAKAGKPVTTDESSIPEVSFTPRPRPELYATSDDVLGTVAAGDRQVLDARDKATYEGNVQRGSRGGHIPEARSMPAQDLIDGEGRWRSREEISELASNADVSLDQPVTAYCNGGVTATQLLFGLHRAGMPMNLLRNYDGSWNEWGEREELPVEGNRDLFNKT